VQTNKPFCNSEVRYKCKNLTMEKKDKISQILTYAITKALTVALGDEESSMTISVSPLCIDSARQLEDVLHCRIWQCQGVHVYLGYVTLKT
jgi:hypothetical protein